LWRCWLATLSLPKEYRWGYELLAAMDEKGFLSAVAAQIGDALCEQGRIKEAEEYTRVSEQAAADDAFASQAMWRYVRAKTQAHQGDLLEAHRLATH
jgi:predicted negative regulator of RcsB-dependent stress response